MSDELDKTYGERIYGVSYDVPPDDIVSEIKYNTAKLADSWADIMESSTLDMKDQDMDAQANTMVKVDYIIRALEKLEECSFLAVKSQYI